MQVWYTPVEEAEEVVLRDCLDSVILAELAEPAAVDLLWSGTTVLWC